jgi:hypothetical protein
MRIADEQPAFGVREAHQIAGLANPRAVAMFRLVNI